MQPQAHVLNLLDSVQEARDNIHFYHLINWGIPWLLVSPLKDLPRFANKVLYQHKEPSILQMFRRHGFIYTLQELNNEARIYLD